MEEVSGMTVKDNEREIALLKEISSKISRFLFGNGGNEVGLDEKFRNWEKELKTINQRIGVIESDLRHFKNVYFNTEGRDALGNLEDQTFLGKALLRIKDRLFDAVILAVVIVIITHLPEIFTQVIEALK